LFGRPGVDVLLVLSPDGTESYQKELQELKTVAQPVVDLVDPVEDSSSNLLGRLQNAPQKIVGYLAKTSRNYVAQALGHVKSYRHSAKISLLGDGMCATCDHGQFIKYVEEAEPMADQIVKMIEH
jgi:hypothetical protein